MGHKPNSEKHSMKNRVVAMNRVAAIEIGSHTARMLIGERTVGAQRFVPLQRRRAYVRLAADCDFEGERRISDEALDRVLEVLKDFVALAEEEEVLSTAAVATGVLRDAANRDPFIGMIQQRTGLRVTVISGEEEALLTQKGVLHGLSIHDDAYLMFDLGGGSTEFIIANGSSVDIRSLDLGCMLLTRRFFSSDPPGEPSLEGLARHVASVLRDAFRFLGNRRERLRIIGNGGTVTTLAAILHRIPVEVIDPSSVNGLEIRDMALRRLLDRMKGMPLAQRLDLVGLDRGRADVILAGLVVVMKILAQFGARGMETSMSDLLEGMILQSMEGDEYEQSRN